MGARVSRYLGAPRWALSILDQGGPVVLLLVAAAAGISVAVGLYGLSGAGLIRRLPALRPVLIVVGCAYALWGARVAQLIALEIGRPGIVPTRFFVIRGAPLLLGLIYLLGASAVPAPVRREQAQNSASSSPNEVSAAPAITERGRESISMRWRPAGATMPRIAP